MSVVSELGLGAQGRGLPNLCTAWPPAQPVIPSQALGSFSCQHKHRPVLSALPSASPGEVLNASEVIVVELSELASKLIRGKADKGDKRGATLHVIPTPSFTFQTPGPCMARELWAQNKTEVLLSFPLSPSSSLDAGMEPSL